MKAIAIYPGSFDPITYGHIDLIERMRPLFDELYVVVANSSLKSSLFTADERADLARLCLPPGVKVQTYGGLTVEFARAVGARVIVRGLRAVADFELESAMGAANKKLAPEIETLFVLTRPEFGFISSRMVKEVAAFGGELKDFVPPPVAQALRQKIKKS
jgi:pantetheine-phosphate adenylyltransferase